MKYLATVFLVTALFFGCDRPEPIPAFLRIEPFTIESTAGGNGMHEVNKGWIYVNNELLGGFELPAEIPVLLEGKVNVQVFPGVTANGQNDSPTLYAPLERQKDSVTLVAGQTATINPATRYDPLLKFAFAPDRTTFDGITSIIFENRDMDNNNTYEVTTQGGLTGKGILMVVDTGHTLLEIASEAVALPNTGDRQVWLEMHHSNDVPFSIQIVTVDDTGFEEAIPLFLTNATQNGGWNKLYFNLTDYLSIKQEPKYRIYYRVRLPTDASGQPTVLRGFTKLDNIRLIHF